MVLIVIDVCVDLAAVAITRTTRFASSMRFSQLRMFGLCAFLFIFLPLTPSAAANVDPILEKSPLLKSQEERRQHKQHHPTKLTGFGSRASLRRSSAPLPLSSVKSDSKNARLWVQKQDEVLLFRCDYQDNGSCNAKSNAENECSIENNNIQDKDNSTVTLAFSIDNGSWNLQRYEEQNDAINSTLPLSLWVPVEGIYGVYTVPSGVIWVLISSSTSVLISQPWGEIRKIKSMELIHVPFQKRKGLVTTKTQRQGNEQHRQVQLLRHALKSHELYFTRGEHNNTVMDMTQSLQRALVGRPKAVGATSSFWWNETSRPDSRFFWNEPALQLIKEQKDADFCILLHHCIPVTSAFVGIQRNVSANDQLTYDEVLISRRSRFRAGTRFTKRGADATGAVANYVETEQVCLVGNHTLLSHVQTRGSIPLRWSSPSDVKTYRPRVRIGTDPVSQARALQNHLLSEWNTYVLETPPPAAAASQPKFLLLNLIDKKKDQGRLGRAFDAVLRAVLDAHASQSANALSSKSVQHIWFDFHAEVKGGRWHKLGKLLTQLSPTLAEHGYFKACRDDMSNDWNIDRLQTGVVRTNCMDCLDRTNVVQSIFGRYALFNELTGIVTPDHKKVLPSEMSQAFRMDSMTLPWKSGEMHHRALWADNADAISRLYAGTPALKRDFTRTGRRTKLGALDDGINSLQRYYLNNFMDADRQEGVDLMTGHVPFSVLRDGEEPHDDAASKKALLKRADRNKMDMSLLQAARTMLEDGDAAGDRMLDEASFVSIKRRRRKNILSQMGGPTLDLRWLPGDLQSHVKASANAEELQDLDRRTASDSPWWVINNDDDTSDAERNENDRREELQKPVNIGHVLGGLIAAIQAPVSTASTVLLILGCMQHDSRKED